MHKSSAPVGRQISGHHPSSRGVGIRPPNSPPTHPGGRGVLELSSDDKALGKLPIIKHRIDDKPSYQSEKPHRSAFDRVPSTAPPRHALDEPVLEGGRKHERSGARSRLDAPEDPRLKTRPPEPPEPAAAVKKSKDKSADKVIELKSLFRRRDN